MRRALGWYKAQLADELPDRLHAHEPGPDDHLGAPRMTEPFLKYISEERSVVQRALARMRRGSRDEQVGALFLYALACRDFDPIAAAAAMGGDDVGDEYRTLPLPEEYACWYAEKAVARLRETIARGNTPRPAVRKAWMDRVGLAARTQER